jgi:undecaprenyl-diphosphatase
LVLGRFLGPVSGFVTFAAAIAEMNRRKFVIWNIISGFPFALALIASGYFLGNVMTRLGPMATRLALFGVAILLALGLLWWLILRVERMFPVVLSIGRSVVRAIGDNADVQSWAARHPKTATFISSRFDTSRFYGLSTTLLALAFLYIFTVWLATSLDFLMADPIIQTDTRLANLMHAFWTPPLLRAFSYITALGDWRVVSLLATAAVSILVLRRRIDLVLGLGVAAIGNVISVALLKWIIDRPRPDLAYFVETSGSFPSGHAAISVAFYGMLFYIGWRLRWLGPLKTAVLGATLAFLIGLSRLYLIEHFLSDVVNGWLIGGLWLVIGIAVAEWWRESRRSVFAPPISRLGARLSVAGLTVALVISATGVVVTYDKTRGMQQPATRIETIATPAALFANVKATTSTQSIDGAPLEPISVIIVAKERATVLDAMKQAGWIRASQPGLAALSKAAWAALRNASDPSAPVTPYFWSGVPNDEAFQRPTKDNSVRERHHVRLWQTRFVLPDGSRIFVGAASFDDGLNWTLLHHISPNIDAERDTLADNLKSSGKTGDTTYIQLSKPRLGQSVAGDPWFTDGKAVVITLR